MLKNRMYIAAVSVEDQRNKYDNEKSFSKIIVQFEVLKLKPRPTHLKPSLSIPNRRNCQHDNKQWPKSIFVNYAEGQT